MTHSPDDEDLNPVITLFWNFWLSFVELIQDLSGFIFFGLCSPVWCIAGENINRSKGPFMLWFKFVSISWTLNIAIVEFGLCELSRLME